MPIATSLPSRNVVLRFPPSAGPSAEVQNGSASDESYQLLELPAEILKQVEGKSEPFPLTIKGRPGDEAVLCTPNSTFLLRTVTISNSLLICRTPSKAPSRPTLEIRDVSHEVLEPIPHAPNLERIRTLLRPSGWKGLDEPWDDGSDEERGAKRRQTAENGHGEAQRKKKKTRAERGYTRAQMDSVIQASEVEIEKGLKERYVIEVDDRMVILPIAHLSGLVTLLLALLTIHGDSSIGISTQGKGKTVSAPVGPFLKTLSDDHDLPRYVTMEVLRLFGTIEDEGKNWHADLLALVKVVGLDVLEKQASSDQGLAQDKFERAWREGVGQDWEDLIDLSLLEGHYLLIAPSSLTRQNLIKYFPAHTLPLHAPTRFSDLFLTKAKWRPEEMKPFLRGLVREGDSKEMDKLIAKFVRVVKEKEGVWWYPRRSN